MARLEFISFQRWKSTLNDSSLQHDLDRLKAPIEGLPQIYWSSGEGWREVNVWAIDRLRSSKLKTVVTLMKHLKEYADYLEDTEQDWRHFPMRKDERVLAKFRGFLIDEQKKNRLGINTIKSRMRAAIQFYRFANQKGLVGAYAPLWTERRVVVTFFDTVGFKRAMTKVVTDLSIPNRMQVGLKLEDGLLPLSGDAMTQLLDHTANNETNELHLMLSLGFFSGARIGTITTLRTTSLDSARPDPFTPGFFLLSVGPGTGVETKFDVVGDIFIPELLMEDLKKYVTSETRLVRKIRAQPENRDVLFLTRQGNPYSVKSVDRLVENLRTECMSKGMQFMDRFVFHQTRATFGTWLMQILLSVTSVADAIRFVRDAMLHSDEQTTFGYVRFIENSKGKEVAAEAFNKAFTGVHSRDWSKYCA